MTRRILRKGAAAAAVLVILAALAVPAAAQTQTKPEDMKKLLAEIIGEYTFTMGTETLVVQFIVQDGKLFGAPPGETPEEIKPVADKPLCFDVTVAGDGNYYFLKFVRNDKGVIDKCIMTTQGMDIEGLKTIK